MKRVFDVVASAAGLLVLSPVLVLVAITVKVESRGPVLYRHTRIGRGLKPFDVLRFRTMRADEPGPHLTVGCDPRVTRIGRLLRHTKLDDLPQLINVLRGEMSLVGPRPEVRQYDHESS